MTETKAREEQADLEIGVGSWSFVVDDGGDGHLNYNGGLVCWGPDLTEEDLRKEARDLMGLVEAVAQAKRSGTPSEEKPMPEGDQEVYVVEQQFENQKPRLCLFRTAEKLAFWMRLVAESCSNGADLKTLSIRRMVVNTDWLTGKNED